MDALGDYKDSLSLKNTAHAGYEQEVVASAKVGDTVTFGHYEQDNDLTNGAEPVEWIVLDRADDRVLVLSKYCLHSMRYNNMYLPTTWATSFMRGWLNNDFYYSAFSVDEQAMVAATVNVTPDNTRSDNPLYHTDGGADTTDRMFLLCGEEVEQYFPNQDDRRAVSTDYAKAQGVYMAEDNSWWWTRTPGEYQHFSTIVRTNGLVQYTGGYLCSKNGGVRPAMWITIAE